MALTIENHVYREGEGIPLILVHGFPVDHRMWDRCATALMEMSDAQECTQYPIWAPDMPGAGASPVPRPEDSGARAEDGALPDALDLMADAYVDLLHAAGYGQAIWAGLSMGGYGTALYALRHPDYFSAAVPMSAALFAPRDVRGDGSNDQAVREYVEGNNPIALLSKLTDDQKKSIRFLLDCGDDDFLLQGNLAFFAEARKLGVPCELRVRNGGHEWGYWRVSLPMALEFIAK